MFFVSCGLSNITSLALTILACVTISGSSLFFPTGYVHGMEKKKKNFPKSAFPKKLDCDAFLRFVSIKTALAFSLKLKHHQKQKSLLLWTINIPFIDFSKYLSNSWRFSAAYCWNVYSF